MNVLKSPISKQTAQDMTNTDFLNFLMEHSPVGALMQVIIIQLLSKAAINFKIEEIFDFDKPSLINKDAYKKGVEYLEFMINFKYAPENNTISHRPARTVRSKRNAGT